MARCKYCGKDIESGSVFTLEGKYPRGRRIVTNPAKRNSMPQT